MLLAFRDLGLEGVEPFVERRELRIIGEGNDHSAVGGVDHPEPSPTELVGIHRSAKFEHDYEVRLDAERPLALLMAHRQVTGALAKPTAVLT